MTTIATDGVSMAGDGLATDGSTVFDFACGKVHRLPTGHIFGLSGSAFDIEIIKQYLTVYFDIGWYAAKPEIWEKTEVLILFPDGHAEYMNHKYQFLNAPIPAASGSGMDYALAAMDHGATAAEAVAIACKRDIHSGGEITVEFI